MPAVAFWPGVAGGTMHYRCITPGEALRRRGWDVVYVEGDEAPADVDVLVFQRAVGDWVAPFIRNFRRAFPRSLVVYDIDDWYEEIPDYNLAARRIDHQSLAWVHEAMAAADLITVSTPELAEGYARFGQTKVLPNYLCPEVWGPENLKKYPRFPAERTRVGWMGAFSWRAGDLELLKPWVKSFLADHPEIDFVSCGGPELLNYLEIKGLTSPRRYGSGYGRMDEHSDFLRPYDHLPSMLAWLDVGLAPLTHNRFNAAKSHAKGLEYNAMGIPVVASPSREYRRYIRPGINGLLARKNWRQQVEKVMADLPSYQAGALKVAAEYWIDDHIHEWMDAYNMSGRALR